MVVRASALLAVAGGLAAYFAIHESLTDLSLWPDVVIVSAALAPATFALVGLALPLRTSRLLLPAVFLLGGATAALDVAHLELAANFTKLAAVTGLAWWVLRFFEEASWVLLVAILIVPVDIFSVARGPTKKIVEEQPAVFDHLSIAFPIPGEPAPAQLGLPDVLFFGLFLAAADRFDLRRRLTWLLMACSFGGTITIAVLFDLSGAPALPLLSMAFVLANGDLLLGSLRRRFGERKGTIPRNGDGDMPGWGDQASRDGDSDGDGA